METFTVVIFLAAKAMFRQNYQSMQKLVNPVLMHIGMFGITHFLGGHFWCVYFSHHHLHSKKRGQKE